MEPRDDLDIEGRAATIGVAMTLEALGRGWWPDGTLLDGCQVPLFTEAEWERWKRRDERDVELINSCMGVEYWLRERQFLALERLAARWPWALASDEDYEAVKEQVLALPMEERLQVLGALFALGWAGLWPAPTGDTD